MSALTQSRVSVLLPRLGVPDGPLDLTSVFGRQAPQVLEIGSGYGAAAVAYCTTFPAHDLVAVDVHRPGMARAAAAAAEAALPNLRLHLGDAVPLLDRLPARSLAALHLFFPDPWPKTKHEKRRFVCADRLALLLDRLAPGGALLVATDQPAYADFLRRQARHLGADVELSGRPTWRPLEGFELKAVTAGRPIVDLRVTASG